MFLCTFPEVLITTLHLTQDLQGQDLIVALRPVCSAIIVDKHANPPLYIDSLGPNTSPETGIGFSLS